MNSYRWPFGTQEIKSELQINGREKRLRVYRERNYCVLNSITSSDVPTGTKLIQIKLAKLPYTLMDKSVNYKNHCVDRNYEMLFPVCKSRKGSGTS
jgi:hypothetical protein